MKHHGKYSKDIPLLPIIKPPSIGQRLHVAWGRSHGVVGVVISVNEQNQTCKMRSPKYKKIWNCDVKWSDLRHLRRTQYNIEKYQQKKEDKA